MQTHRPYPTPSQSAIYIGEYHIDDAYAVDWNSNDSNSPLYTYFKKTYVNVSLGKQLVTGSLAINFRYPGYLTYAVAEARKTFTTAQINEISQHTRDGKASLEFYLDTMRSGSTEDRLRLLMESAAQGAEQLDKMSALSFMAQSGGANIDQGGATTRYLEVFDVQNPWEVETSPIDIWVHYGDLDQSHIADIIEDVMFTGKSKQIQAGVLSGGGISASGNNILELYSFYAKRVTQVQIDPGQPLVGTTR